MSGATPGKNNRGGPSAKFGGSLISQPLVYSDDSPTLLRAVPAPDVFSGLYAWWDFTALALSNDAAMPATVSDLSGNGRDLAKVGSPTYKTNVFNGLGGMYSNYLNRMKYVIGSTLAQPFSMFAVWRNPTAADTNWVITALTGAVPLMGANGSTNFRLNATTILGGGTPALNTNYYQWANVNGNSSEMYASSTTAKVIGPAGSTGFTSGGSNEISVAGYATANFAWVAEVWLYSQTRSATEQAGLVEYVNDKYAMGITQVDVALFFWYNFSMIINKAKYFPCPICRADTRLSCESCKGTGIDNIAYDKAVVRLLEATNRLDWANVITGQSRNFRCTNGSPYYFERIWWSVVNLLIWIPILAATFFLGYAYGSRQ